MTPRLGLGVAASLLRIIGIIASPVDQFEAVDAGTVAASTLEVDGAVIGDRGDQTQALRVQFVVVAKV